MLCQRPASQHATPVEYGGESIVPACELLHPGGLLPEGPPAPRPPTARRIAIARTLSRVEAHAIAGNLGEPSKMPGASYGLDAWQCHAGAELSQVANSTCEGCYAKKNFYAYWWPAKIARARRQAAIHHPLWVEAMIALVHEYVRGVDAEARQGTPRHDYQPGVYWFRWHDSGDLESVDHLEDICQIAAATPAVSYWLPTRELGILRQFFREGGALPTNLCVRVSAHMVGGQPESRQISRDPVSMIMAALPTSTVHLTLGEPVPIDGARRNATMECRASTRDNFCGECRACWTPRVANVSYPKH